MSNLPYWLAAAHLPAMPPQKFLQCLQTFASIEQLFSAPLNELIHAGLSSETIAAIKQPNWESIEKELRWMQDSLHHIVTYEDPRYPFLLKQLVDSPLILYVKGNVSALANQQIAMVGSRNATTTGIKSAEKFGESLSSAGLTVTSGLALGIDGASHRGALAANGITIAVCGTGLNRIYPHSHRKLAEKILQENGALISEFWLDAPPIASNFPRRNRIIAGLCVGVLIVEAAIKSGSLITARLAAEQGKDVFAIPGSILNPLSQGCHYLIRQGAKLVERVEDILEELAIPNSSLLKVKEPLLSTTAQDIFRQISYETTPIDVIVLRSQLTVGEVSSILLVLELNGYIQSVPGGYIRAIY